MTRLSDPTPSDPPPEGGATYDARDLARRLKCSIRHVRRLDADRTIPGRMTLGRLVRFLRQPVDEWIAAGCPAPAGEGVARG